MPKPNPETSYYEVTKILFDTGAVEKHLQRVDVVQGENRAAGRAAHFDRHMTEEERQEKITHRIRATSRGAYEEWLREEQRRLKEKKWKKAATDCSMTANDDEVLPGAHRKAPRGNSSGTGGI